MKKVLAATIVIFILMAQGNAQSKKAFNFETQLGVVDENLQKEVCLTIPNADLAEGSRIILISPYKPQSMAKAVVGKRLTKSCSTNPDVPANVSFYSLKLLKGYENFHKNDEPNPPAIAVIGSTNPVKIRKGVASIDLNDDGLREHFRKCTSNEGIHLTVWSGTPLRGKRQWAWYYYLSYDVVPTCKVRDYQE